MRYVWFAVVACLLLPSFGCGGRHYVKTEPVTGTVTLDGEPFSGVVVTFMPVGDGNMGFALTNGQGVFHISTLVGRPDSGTTIDEYRVYFSKEIDDVSKQRYGKDPETNERVLLPNPYQIQVVPKKYTKAETSGFTVKVERGKNVFQFDLSSK